MNIVFPYPILCVINMKISIDWGRKKKHMAMIDNNVKEADDNFLLSLPTDSVIYLERGCPSYILYKLIQKGCKVFQIDGKLVKEERERKKVKKSDIDDVKIIDELRQSCPDVFVELSEKDKNQVLLELYLKKYNNYMRLKVMLELQRQAFIKEFGEEMNDELYELKNLIDVLDKKKQEIITSVFDNFPQLKNDLLKFKHIKGLGPRYFLGILATANPLRFETVGRFLSYCGYTKKSKESHKFNRGVKSLFFQVSEGTIKHSDPVYRPLYDEIKQKLKSKYPDYRPGKINDMTKVRVATLIAKEFWRIYRGNSVLCFKSENPIISSIPKSNNMEVDRNGRKI